MLILQLSSFKKFLVEPKLIPWNDDDVKLNVLPN